MSLNINLVRGPMTVDPASYIELNGVIELPRGATLDNSVIDIAIGKTNKLFIELDQVSPYISELLGLRNISALVGQAFAKEVEEASDGMLRLNPHQDGYPDLLLMDGVGQIEFDNALPGSKTPFSPFAGGGLEVKATCGDVKSAKDLAKIGKSKPKMGETRISLVTGINWKSHHRKTNRLCGIVWDYIKGVPTIAAVTYSSDLEESDWGRIIQPKRAGGRTTSVSIMSRSGVRKMCRNAIRVLPGPYLALVQKFARS